MAGLNDVVEGAETGGEPQGNLSHVLPLMEGPASVQKAMRERSVAMNHLDSPFAENMLGQEDKAEEAIGAIGQQNVPDGVE